MHIPEGYLSPSTCVALYAAATPFWYVAGQRVKQMLSARMVPMLSVFAAFSFVIMMFNLPLPGGTTGHATGAAIAAIVLGPWGAMIAVSIALAIQAIFFGEKSKQINEGKNHRQPDYDRKRKIGLSKCELIDIGL